MQLDKFNINIEKIGDIEIFSHNGYMLGFSDRKDTNSISFAPFVINTKDYNEKNLDFCFDFIDMAWAYSYYDYYPSYAIYFKEYNKVYNNRDRYDIMELMELSSGGDVCITPEYSLKMADLVVRLINECSSKDKSLIVNTTYDNKTTINTISIDEDNYVRIVVDYFEQYFMSYHSTSDKIDDMVRIFEHVFKMLDKSLGKDNQKVNSKCD